MAGDDYFSQKKNVIISHLDHPFEKITKKNKNKVNKESKDYSGLLFVESPLIINIRTLGSKRNVGLNIKTTYAPYRV